MVGRRLNDLDELDVIPHFAMSDIPRALFEPLRQILLKRISLILKLINPDTMRLFQGNSDQIPEYAWKWLNERGE